MADSASSRRFLAKVARPQTPPPWSITDVFTTFIALALAMLLIGPTLIGGGNAPTSAKLLFGWLIGLAIVIVFIAISRQRQRTALRLGAGDSLWPLPYALLVGVASALTINVITGLAAGFHSIIPLSGIGQNATTDWLIAGLFVVLIQPLAEGLVFQGVTLPRLRASLGAWPGVAATTMIYMLYFAGIYAATTGGPTFFWYGLMVPLLSTFVLSIVRIYTESTRATIITHIGMGLTFLVTAIVLAG